MWLRSKVIQNQIAWELSMGTSSWHWNSTCSSESDSRITSMEFPRQTRMIKAPNRRVSQWVLILGIGSWCKVIILNHTWPRVAGIQYVCLWSRWMYCFMLIFFRSSTTWPDTSASRRLNFQTPNTYRPSAASSFLFMIQRYRRVCPWDTTEGHLWWHALAAGAVSTYRSTANGIRIRNQYWTTEYATVNATYNQI